MLDSIYHHNLNEKQIQYIYSRIIGSFSPVFLSLYLFNLFWWNSTPRKSYFVVLIICKKLTFLSTHSWIILLLHFMHSLFYDKRLIPSHKKKSQKKDLPELKHPFMFVKRVNNSIAHQSEHFKVLPYYPLLSNVLVSKKIDPPPPPRLLALIRQKDHSQLFHNFRFR